MSHPPPTIYWTERDGKYFQVLALGPARGACVPMMTPTATGLRWLEKFAVKVEAPK